VRGFGELEAVIMDRVWEHAEPVTVRELHGELSAGRVIAYATPGAVSRQRRVLMLRSNPALRKMICGISLLQVTCSPAG
jgi:hypothetical protein